MTLVLDPSVLLSALAGHTNSPSAELLAGIRSGTVQAVACPRLIAELRSGLRKPYFSSRISEQEAVEAVAAIERAVIMLPDPHDPPHVLRDSGDDYLVALAQRAGAEAIVTGDRDLLDHTNLTPKAMSPRDACQHLGLLTATDEEQKRTHERHQQQSERDQQRREHRQRRDRSR